MASTLGRLCSRASLHTPKHRSFYLRCPGKSPFARVNHDDPVGLARRSAAFSTSQSRKSEVVQIPIEDQTHDFSALLLRDSCECPKCVHPDTKQRLFSTADIPRNISGRAMVPSESDRAAVGVDWNHDAPGFDSEHRSELPISSLRNIAKSGVPPGPYHDRLENQTLWDAQSYQLQTLDYDSYMYDDRALYQAIRQLRTHGLIFVENCPGVEKSVSAIAERIGPVKDTFYGYTWDVRSVAKPINAAYLSQSLGFHTDLLYFDNPPHVQLLHCIQSSSDGGASLFVDAYKAAIDLFHKDREAFNILATIPVNYHYNHVDSNLYHATKPVIETRPLRVGDKTYQTLEEFMQAHEENRKQINVNRSSDAKIPSLRLADCFEKINWGPPFLAPFTLQEESLEQATLSRGCALTSLNQKVDAWHAAAQKLNTLLHRPDTMYERLMKPGECVLFDNTRVLHGRKAFDARDAGKSRWLRGTYVDKDPFLSKLRVLRNQYGDSDDQTPTAN